MRLNYKIGNMKNTVKIYLGMVLLCALGFAACQKTTSSATIDCTGVTPTYTADIKTIMTGNCATKACHSAGTAAGGYDLSNYASCKSAKDRIVGSVQHLSGYQSMPQGAAKLDDASIKKIVCWSQNGCMQ